MSYPSRWRGMLRCLSVMVGVGVGPCISLQALAGTILVPSQAPTIQAGIDAAANGDTIMVAAGTYSGAGNRDIDLKGKSIIIKSSAGPLTCILDAGGPQAIPHSVFILQGNEPATTIIDGFTITGGAAVNGGGVCFLSSSATVRNCIIFGNSATGSGGGVFSQSPGTPRLYNCTIQNNIAAGQGGGVCAISSGIRVENCALKGNAAVEGGGVATVGGTPLVVNCLMVSNTGAASGGGAYHLAGKIVNCTMVANSSPSGSGVYAGDGMPIANSILWANTGSSQVGSTPVITYSLVQDGYPGTGNRSANPKFLNPSAGDYRLAYKSPAIDCGSNPQVPAGVAKDLAGINRFIDDYTVTNAGEGKAPVVDMGAYEKALLVKPPSAHGLPG